MKKYIVILLIFFLGLITPNTNAYNIKVKIKGLKNEKIHLAYYFEDSHYIVNTITLNNRGEGVFYKKDTLKAGIYLVIIPKKSFFDILIDKDTKFSIKTDTVNYIENMKISKSFDNKIFYEYQKKAVKIFKKINSLNLKKKNTTKDSISIIDKKLKDLSTELDNIQKKYLEKYPDSFFAALLKAMRSKSNDDFDFSDARLLRSPMMYRKIRMHIAKNIESGSANINKENDDLIKKTEANMEIYQYVTTHLLSFYNTFYKIGMNEVFVHIAEKYFLPKKAKWLPTKALKEIAERRDMFKKSFVGQKASDIKLKDSTGNNISLFSLKSRYIILFFWSTGCGHCENVNNKLVTIYEELKKKDIEVFSINTSRNHKEWKQMLKAGKYKWLNGMDIDKKSMYQIDYYVFSTPSMYFIDNNRKIVAKRYGDENINAFIDYVIKN